MTHFTTTMHQIHATSQREGWTPERTQAEIKRAIDKVVMDACFSEEPDQVTRNVDDLDDWMS